MSLAIDTLSFSSTSMEQDEVRMLLPVAAKLLEHDFQRTGIDLVFQDDALANVFELRDALIPWIQKTGGPGAEVFYRLLYLIDLSEARVREVTQDDGIDVYRKLAELMIIRALQKAWYRKQYKNS